MNAKGILQSKTIWGLLIAFAGMIFGWSPEVQAATTGDVVNIADKVITLLGLLWAFYGRLKATTPVKLGGTADGGGGLSGGNVPYAVAGLCLLALGLAAGVGTYGCAKGGQVLPSMAEHQALAKTAVQLATVEVCRATPRLAAPAALAATALKRLVEGGEITSLEEATAWADQVVRWDKLSAEEQLLVANLVNVAGQEVSRLVQGRTPPEVRAGLALVLGWIAEAAKAAGQVAVVACHEPTFDFREEAAATNRILSR